MSTEELIVRVLAEHFPNSIDRHLAQVVAATITQALAEQVSR